METIIPKTNSNSILGLQSHQYRILTQDANQIYDDPDKGTLEFFIAGYTKLDEHGINRQYYYRELFQEAEKRESINKLNPLHPDLYKLTITHDPNNKYDPNLCALKIDFHSLDNDLYIRFRDYFNPINLGFVPQRINQVLLKNIKMINDIRILKLCTSKNADFISAKIVIAYGHNYMTMKDHKGCTRFVELMDE